MIELKALYLEGLWDEADWQLLIQTLQYVEARHPEHNYKAFIVEGTREMSVDEVKAFFDRSMRPRPGREITTAVFRKREPQ